MLQVPPGQVVLGSLLLVLLSSVSLSILATYSHLVLIVAVAMAGAGVASVFASGMVQHSLFCSFFSPLLHLFAVVGEGTNGGEQQNQLGLHHVLQRLLTTLRTLDRWIVSSNNQTHTEQNIKREFFV